MGVGWAGVPPVQNFTSEPQGRAVRPGTPCLPLTVPTNALAVVLTSGMVFSVCRDTAAQVTGYTTDWPGEHSSLQEQG